MSKSQKAKDIIEERYGKEGKEQRDQFREEAFAYYFSEIIKSCRKELNITQNNLAEKVGKKRP